MPTAKATNAIVHVQDFAVIALMTDLPVCALAARDNWTPGSVRFGPPLGLRKRDRPIYRVGPDLDIEAMSSISQL